MSLAPAISQRIGQATTLAINAGDSDEARAVRETAQTLDRQQKRYERIAELPARVRSLLRKYPPPPQGLG